MIHSIEVAFESIQVSGPEAAELGEPGIDLLKWFRFQPVETALCVHCGLHETGVAQDSQVLGNGRLRHTKPALDLSHRLLGRGQQAQYGASVRLRNDFEYRFHSLDILHRVYTCQGILRGTCGKTVGKRIGAWNHVSSDRGIEFVATNNRLDEGIFFPALPA